MTLYVANMTAQLTITLMWANDLPSAFTLCCTSFGVSYSLMLPFIDLFCVLQASEVMLAMSFSYVCNTFGLTMDAWAEGQSGQRPRFPRIKDQLMF